MYINNALYKYIKSLTLGIFNFWKSGLECKLYSENVIILTAFLYPKAAWKWLVTFLASFQQTSFLCLQTLCQGLLFCLLCSLDFGNIWSLVCQQHCCKLPIIGTLSRCYKLEIRNKLKANYIHHKGTNKRHRYL